MKRVLWFGIILIVCVTSIFAFTACNIELKDMDGTEYYNSTEKDRSLELVDTYFEEMLKDPDFVVTCRDAEGALLYTETVKGGDSYTLRADGSQVYAFKKGGHFYVAFVNKGASGEEQRSYYCSDSTKRGYYGENALAAMDAMYKQNHCAFMNETSGAGAANESLAEKKGATFLCKKRIERVSGFATSSLEFAYVSEPLSITIMATAEETNVQTLHVVIEKESGEKSDLTWTFAYGGASVTLPDVESWA